MKQDSVDSVSRFFDRILGSFDVGFICLIRRVDIIVLAEPFAETGVGVDLV